MGFGFGMFGIMFSLVFMLVFGMIIMTFVKGISQWNKNNNSPRLTVPATVVAKRTNVSHHHHGGVNEHHHHHTSTTYYVTFEVQSGDRMELNIPAGEYGSAETMPEVFKDESGWNTCKKAWTNVTDDVGSDIPAISSPAEYPQGFFAPSQPSDTDAAE